MNKLEEIKKSRSLGYRIHDSNIDWLIAEVERLQKTFAVVDEKLEKLIEGRIDVAQCLDRAIISMQSIYIAGKAESQEKAMEWLYNYLWGPGLLPSEDDIAMGAQAFYDKHDPLQINNRAGVAAIRKEFGLEE